MGFLSSMIVYLVLFTFYTLLSYAKLIKIDECKSSPIVIDSLIIVLSGALLYSFIPDDKFWLLAPFIEALVIPRLWLSTLILSNDKKLEVSKLTVGLSGLLFLSNLVVSLLIYSGVSNVESQLYSAWRIGRLFFIAVSVVVIVIVCETVRARKKELNSLLLVTLLTANSYLCFRYFTDFLSVGDYRLTFDLMFLVPVSACLFPFVELYLKDQGSDSRALSKPVMLHPVSKENASEDSQLIEKVMSSQKLYLNQGISSAQFARTLHWSESRVRKVVKELGYKNFNDMINHYRILDACHHLEDKAYAHIPVSTIALEVGYKSVSVFHRIFKDRKSLTPKEYRQIHCLIDLR